LIFVAQNVEDSLNVIYWLLYQYHLQIDHMEGLS
jgi:hypothetical protein